MKRITAYVIAAMVLGGVLQEANAQSIGISGKQAIVRYGSVSGFSEGIQSAHGDPSPSAGESDINTYTFQDEQVNLDANTGNVRVLRTDQKALVNDFQTAVFEIKNVHPREIRNVVRSVLKLEGGRAEAIRDKANGRAFIQVVAPEFMMPHLERMIAELDESWVEDYNDGAVTAYYKALNRDASEVDFIASRYASDNGFTELDVTNNAAVRFDEPYRVESYLKGAKKVDIPANQVELEVTIYEINANNDLKLGLDYINWRNGPGRNLWEFIYNGADAQTDANNATSIFDPFRTASEFAGFQKEAELFNDFDQYFRGVNYLLTSNYIDFLQVNGRARLMERSVQTVSSSHSAYFTADDVVVALVSEPGDTNSVDADTAQGASDTVEIDRNPRFGNEPQIRSVVVDPNRRLRSRPAGSTGLFMNVTPFVGTESMELVVAISNADLNGLTPNGQPIINTRNVSTSVRLMDGEPYVISGLKRTTEIEETAKAPLLGSIPVLGYLFGGENTVNRTNDIVIVIKPTFILSSQPNVENPQVKNIASIVVDGAPLETPAATVGYDQWLFDD